ncbi:MAG: HAMP domain-containing protein, partial [Vulcanimicrobiota bacterium]
MFKFNLRKKILISYILLLIILTFISFQAIRSLMQLSSITEQVIKENYESIFAAQSILKILERHQISQWMLIAGKNEAAKQILNENREEFFKWLDDAKANASLQGEAELVKKIEYFYIEYLAHYNWLEKSLQEKNTANIELYTKTARWQLDKLRQHTLSLIEMNRKAMLNSIQQSKKISENYISTVIIISGLGIFVGVGVSLLLTHIIVRPVENLTTAVSEVRKGNLDVSVETEYSDEIGILATEFNKMIKRLREYQTLNLEKLIEEKKRTEAVLRSVGDCMIVIDPH